MQKSDVRIVIRASMRYHSHRPEILLTLDDEILASGPQEKDLVLDIQRNLGIGPHRLSLQFTNKSSPGSADLPDMAVIVESLRFQYLEQEFNIYSQYRPDYPESWLQQQRAKQIETPEVIHSNYLGWNGTWWVDFEAPIYRWIHQKLDLGWLI
jgi:hypothetical protein